MSDEHNLKHRDCGTMAVHRRLLDTVPRYAEARARVEEHAFRVNMGMAVARPGCTQIPVVVHVVWKDKAQNISKDQIDSQMEVLNQDFRKRNPDVSNVPAPFAPLAGDARIEFVLADRDPDGNPTDGVTRTKTTQSGFGSDDAVKFDSSGGKDAWPSDQYLNMWVCQLSGGLLGYAQFPGGPAETDGVVMTHTGFGTTGTASPPFDKGRTATHEIGHWLNLFHIWGDDGSGCTGSDSVADTPNQGGANTGKPTFPKVSCNNGPNGDMFMNYMDYVDDDTMVMFSEGQIARMQACLDGPRSTIGKSIPCHDLVPKALPKDPPKEIPKELPKEFPKDPPKELPKDGPKELPKDPPKDIPKDLPKDPPKDIPKDLPKDPPKDIPKDIPKDPPKDPPKENPKDFQKELPKDNPKDFQKEFPKDHPKDLQKEFPKDHPKDFQKEFPKDPPKDPPKSIFEPPIDFPQIPVKPPIQPPTSPFVLATGSPQGSAMDQQRNQMLQSYAQLLGQFARLHEAGMLDAQGFSAWQQAWASYQQLGGN